MKNIDLDIYKPVRQVSKDIGITRQWISKKGKQGSIRTIKPFEDVNLIFYNLDDAKKLFGIK